MTKQKTRQKGSTPDSTEDSASTAGSTDVLARKEGNFERHKLVGHNLVIRDPEDKSNLKTVQDATRAEFILLEFESVDGCRVVARPMTQFLIYNSQGGLIDQVLENKYAYLNVGNRAVEITSDAETARLIEGGNTEVTRYPVGLTEITNKMFSSLIQNLQIRLGTRSYPTFDREGSSMINCSVRNDMKGMGFNEAVCDFRAFVRDMPEHPVEGHILEVENPNKISMLIRGKVYNVDFEGRPGDDEHVPTKIAENLNVRIAENLEGEDIVVGSGRYVYKNTNYKFLGRNSSKTLAFGIQS